MNDERGPTAGENGVGIIAQRHIGGDQRSFGFALGVNGEVGDIASVWALWVLQAMMFSVGIKMRTGRFEVRPLTLAGLMNVDSVLAGRKCL